jgi:hypothetical protein
MRVGVGAPARTARELATLCLLTSWLDVQQARCPRSNAIHGGRTSRSRSDTRSHYRLRWLNLVHFILNIFPRLRNILEYSAVLLRELP